MARPRPLPAGRPVARGAFALHVIALLALAPPCLAAPKEAPGGAGEDTAVVEAARTRYAEGMRLYGRGRYEEARAAFLQAAALTRRPAATLMVAWSALKAGRWLEAAKTFDAYALEVGEVPSKLKVLVESGRQEARAHLGRLRLQVPEGAEVRVDGERVAPLEGGGAETVMDVMPGPHTVVVTHRGEQRTEAVTAQAGATVDVKPAFVPKPLVPTSDTRARPEDRTAATGQPYDGPTILSPPATAWPAYVAAVVGLGGLSAAAIFGGLHANELHAVDVTAATLEREGKPPAGCRRGIPGPADDPRRYDETCLTLRRNEELARSHLRAFQASMVVGLAGAALAIGWYLLAPKDIGGGPTSTGRVERPARPRLVPWVGIDSGGASLEGRF